MVTKLHVSQQQVISSNEFDQVVKNIRNMKNNFKFLWYLRFS